MRLLIAPVQIAPTKPLTPSHVKGLVWVDLLARATAGLCEVTVLSNRATVDTTRQVLGFWHHLSSQPATDWSDKSERWIGERYVEYQARAREQDVLDVETLSAYRDRVERSAWLHPAGERIVSLWEAHYRLLGLRLPLRAHAPLPMSFDELIDRLRRLGCLVDLARWRGGSYVDLTEEGLALRQIRDRDGGFNQLGHLLRELMPLAPQYDQVVLMHDEELWPDYLALQKILERSGAKVARIAVGRVGLHGQVKSARHGGWADFTVDRLAASVGDRLTASIGDRVSTDAFRVGMRLYLVAGLGRKERAKSFETEWLNRWVHRASVMLAAPVVADGQEELVSLLKAARGRNEYVNPYHLTTRLLNSRATRIRGTALRQFYA